MAIGVASTAMLMLASPALAGVYDSAVLADAPSVYWRLGEADGATTASDSSGNGVTLNYATTALLDEDAGIQNETNTSAAADGSTIASLPPARTVPTPGAFEAWLRTNVPSSDANIYLLQDGGGNTYTVTVGIDGLLHASIRYSGVCCQNVTMVGPSSKPVTDGVWHHVVVSFATAYVYVDLTAGPPGTIGGNGFQPAAFGSTSLSLGGLGFRGQLDEVAVYPNALSTTRMSAHASAGGLGWDAFSPGGEEGSPPGCPERGVFGSGFTAPTGGAIDATGALTYIAITRKDSVCGFAPLPPYTTIRPTYIVGHTVRIKFGGDDPIFFDRYVEFGPIQEFCSPVTTCYKLYFDMKVPGINDHPDFPFPTGCTAVGVVHGYKLQHVGSQWEAWFLCDTGTSNWVRIYSRPDGGAAWDSGWPDTEWFDHGLACGGRTSVANCWKREGTMGDTHTNFQWQDASGWHNVPYARCRWDTSYRWDFRQATYTPPISAEVWQNPRITVANKNNPSGPNGCTGP